MTDIEKMTDERRGVLEEEARHGFENRTGHNATNLLVEMWSEIVALRTRLQDQAKEQAKVLDKLPKTADGVSIVPYVDEVYAPWNPIYKWCATCDCWYLYDDGWHISPHFNWGVKHAIHDCYSTRKAAEAAKEAEADNEDAACLLERAPPVVINGDDMNDDDGLVVVLDAADRADRADA